MRNRDSFAKQGFYDKTETMKSKAKIGVIGGSGIYEIEGMSVIDEVKIKTPFGDPSDSLVRAQFEDREFIFLPRHGKGHRILPSDVNSKANLWALKSLGVENVISISAVGSLQEQYPPEDFVIPDQLIDRTRSRPNSFFGEGIVGHVSFAEPFCADLSKRIFDAIQSESKKGTHLGGTYVCMEGPLFSTKAESHLYRSWGCDIIGMTALPEAKLAREAEMAYATIGTVTDYDCWREDEAAVSVETVMKHVFSNVARIKILLPSILKAIPDDFSSPHHQAARFAIMTSPTLFPGPTREKLSLFYSKYWEKN